MKKLLALLTILAVLMAGTPALAKSTSTRGPIINDGLYGPIINDGLY